LDIGFSTAILIGIVTAGAGILGSMLGLGGGVFIVPILSIFFGIDLKTVIAASAVSVIANSVVGSSVHLRSRFTNLRLAVLMEIATTIGALAGGLIAVFLAPNALRAIFGVVMLYVAYAMLRRSRRGSGNVKHGGPDPLRLGATFHDPATGLEEHYIPQHMLLGVPVSAIAGIFSGLLGIGGGVIKVPIMNTIMNVPVKAAAATSPFMAGITVSASAFVYYSEGYIDPRVTVPAMLGIFIGARVGAQFSRRFRSATLVKILVVIMLYLAVSLLLQAAGIKVPGAR
jgi:uncharacterized membrane protein YfcA